MMEQKLKGFKSLSRLDYNSYKKLVKKTWSSAVVMESPIGYVLIKGGAVLPWKNSKTEDLPQQPLLYLGALTKWKAELKGQAELSLQDYSYGSCQARAEGGHIYVQLLPLKGKASQEKQLKVLQKVFKTFKPKVFLEVVSSFEVAGNALTAMEESDDLDKIMQQLEGLFAFDALIREEYKQYKKWLQDASTIEKNKKYLAQAKAAVSKETQALILQFYTEYNTLPKTERRKYQKGAILVKSYQTIKSITQQWLHSVALFRKLMQELQAISMDFTNLNIGHSEGDLKRVSKEKQVPMEQLLARIEAYEVRLKKASRIFTKTTFETFKYQIAQLSYLLRLGLQRMLEDLLNPAIQPPRHPAHSHYNWQPLEGAVFRHPVEDSKEPLIADNDVLQGALGDCYLLASLIGLAKKCPELIRQAIEEKRAGDKVTYAVKLYLLEGAGTGKLVPQTIMIDNQFLVDTNGTSAYAQQADQKELWVLILEKAMAKALGGFEALEGGNTAWALRMLTGEFPVTKRCDKDMTAAAIVQFLQENQGKVITVGIGEPVIDNVLFGATNALHERKYKNEILVTNHAYTIERIDYVALAQGNLKADTIILHNPHNTEYQERKFPKISPLVLERAAVNITIV